MNGSVARYALPLLGSLVWVACSGSGAVAPDGAISGGLQSSCRQKAGADGDDDCAGRGALTRKLDCGDAAQLAAAVALGCQPEQPDDPQKTDVCCPTTVSGVPDVEPGGDAGPLSDQPVVGPDATVLENLVTCGQIRSREPLWTAVGATLCECSSSGGASSPSFDGEICGQGDEELFCCADSGFPGSGDCGCQLTRPWRCHQIETGPAGNVTKCSCAFIVNPNTGLVVVPTCNLATPNVTTCCSSSELPAGCECRNVPCSAGETEVSDCTTPGDARLLPEPTECPAGRVEVSTCSDGLSASRPEPGTASCDPASCSGSDCASSGGFSFCCFWSCGAGGCEQNCTD